MWDSMRDAARRVFAPEKSQQYSDESVVWNEFVQIYQTRKRANWRLPVGCVRNLFEFREMQLDLPMIEGTRTAFGVEAGVALRVSVKEGKMVLYNGPRVFRGTPSEAFDFLNELYDISASRSDMSL
jgi:hypothetical protein